MSGIIQQKRRGDQSARGPRCRLGGLSRRCSPRNSGTGKLSSPSTITAKNSVTQPRTSLDEVAARKWLSRSRHRPVAHREAYLLSPSLSSIGEPDVNIQDGATAFTLLGETTRDDDAESQGSMTTWPGDRGEDEEGTSAQDRGDSSFNFDWSDERGDKQPVPWKEIQSYVDFHENRDAHEYWEWDREVLKWRHVDAETGEAVFCNAELD